jgi:hypothetical protein
MAIRNWRISPLFSSFSGDHFACSLFRLKATTRSRAIPIVKLRVLPFAFAALWVFTLPGLGESPESAPRNAYAAWKNGPPSDSSYFPIGVWVQNPANAARYKELGINLYVGLWRGPTASQLEELRKAGMPVICAQSSTGLEFKDDPLIVGWMHGDEPDNAQSLGKGKGYGPPIAPEKIVADYARMKSADPTRPILLNLGQGVAWDNYIGRGVRRNHPEDYPQYIKGCDIASFDIYPAVHDSPEVAGKLEFVGHGVERLVGWAGDAKSVWNCIECTHIENARTKATPQQVRAEVWMSLIHGSRGLIYFVHQFQPTFKEAALLEDPEMVSAITKINHQIRVLAPVLNSRNISRQVHIKSSAGTQPIKWMLKQYDGSIYLFAVNMTRESIDGEFEIAGLPDVAFIDVLGEERRLSAQSSGFRDTFAPYAVHLYRMRSW